LELYRWNIPKSSIQTRMTYWGWRMYYRGWGRGGVDRFYCLMSIVDVCVLFLGNNLRGRTDDGILESQGGAFAISYVISLPTFLLDKAKFPSNDKF
jgi:hypothetical protein